MVFQQSADANFIDSTISNLQNWSILPQLEASSSEKGSKRLLHRQYDADLQNWSMLPQLEGGCELGEELFR